jgi:hypothetical protein
MKLQPPTQLIDERWHKRAPIDINKIHSDDGEPPWTAIKKR